MTSKDFIDGTFLSREEYKIICEAFEDSEDDLEKDEDFIPYNDDDESPARHNMFQEDADISSMPIVFEGKLPI